MTLIDARTLETGTRLEADVAIVGAGAAGTTVATALERAGFRVLLIESGGLEPDEEVQALYEMEEVGYPLRPQHMPRARYYGGSCNLWAGRCMRLHPMDFEDRPWVADGAWPIGPEEIERHLPEAARILDLPTIEHFDLGPHAHRLTETENRLVGAAGLTPTISLWAPKPQRFRGTLRHLERSERVTLIHDASVTGLHLDEPGRRIEQLGAQTLDGRRLEIRARHIVLAAGGLETPRLLLASNDRRRQGIGNDHDLVGRFFMDHPRTAYGRAHMAPGKRLRMMRGWPLKDGKVQLGLGVSPERQAEEGLLNHYLTLEEVHSDYVVRGYQQTVEMGKVLLRRGHAGSRLDLGKVRDAKQLKDFIYLLSPKEILPHGLWRAMTVARHALPQRAKPRTFAVVYFCEQPPVPESRVALGHEVDRLGLPRLVFDWRIPESVDRSLKRLEALLGRTLEETGIGRLEPGEGRPSYTDASHHMGTTRMSTDPRRGVVDPDGRVHDVDNLFIAGSGVFPSAGHANPTLTIVALALRLADHLAGRLAHG